MKSFKTKKTLFKLLFERINSENSIIFKINANENDFNEALTTIKENIVLLNNIKNQKINKENWLLLTTNLINLNNSFIMQNDLNKRKIKSFSYCIKNEYNLKTQDFKTLFDDFIIWLEELQSNLEYLKNIILNNKIYVQVFINNLKNNNWEFYIDDTFFSDINIYSLAIEEISYSLQNNYIPEYKNQLLGIRLQFELLFKNMQVNNVDYFLKTVDEIFNKKDFIMQNKIFYYEYSNEYSLLLIERYRKAYKIIKNHILYAYKYAFDLSCLANHDQQTTILGFLHSFTNQPFVRILKNNTNEKVSKFVKNLTVQYFSKNFNEKESDILLNLPLKIFEFNKKTYNIKWREFQDNFFENKSQKNVLKKNDFYYLAKSDNELIHINYIIHGSEYKKIKDSLPDFMVYKYNFEKFAFSNNVNNFNLQIYSNFINIYAFNTLDEVQNAS